MKMNVYITHVHIIATTRLVAIFVDAEMDLGCTATERIARVRNNFASYSSINSNE